MHRRRLAKTVRADQSVPLLAGGVPNLGLDDLAVDLEAAGGELDTDGGLGLEAELVLGEAGEEVGLADAGVADEHHLEEVVVVVLGPVPASVGSHCSPPSREGRLLLARARCGGFWVWISLEPGWWCSVTGNWERRSGRRREAEVTRSVEELLSSPLLNGSRPELIRNRMVQIVPWPDPTVAD